MTRRLSRQHFALYRGYLDGVELRQLHLSYGETGTDQRLTGRLITMVRDTLAQAARRARDTEAAHLLRLKPGSKSTWVALIRGLYLANYYDEALTQIEVAREHCGDKPDFRYFYAAVLFEQGKSKEGLLQLEKALKEAPAKAKLFTELNPEYLRRTAVTDLMAKYKKK